MNLELSDEERMLQASVREFAEEVVRPRAAAIDQSGEFPRDVFAAAGALGLAGVAVPVEYGGSGMDTVSYTIVIEEISRACANTGVILSVNNSLVCDPIEKFGNEDQKRRFLVPLAKGEKLGCFALTEPDAGSDAGNQKTRAVRDRDFYRISGQKVFITCGQAADVCLLFAMTDPEKKARGISAFLVDANARGFDRSRHQVKLGVNASGTVEIFLTDVEVPAGDRLGEEGEGFKIAMRILDRSRPGVAAQALGIAQGATDYALEYAKTRETMGKPIAQHQLIQAKLADMETECEAARGLLYRFGEMVDDGVDGAELTKASAMAKLKCGDVAMAVTTDAVQILGGYGYIKEYPVERFMRDAKITQIYEGTQEIQRLVIAREMMRESRAFLLAGVA